MGIQRHGSVPGYVCHEAFRGSWRLAAPFTRLSSAEVSSERFQYPQVEGPMTRGPHKTGVSWRCLKGTSGLPLGGGLGITLFTEFGIHGNCPIMDTGGLFYHIC